RSETYFGRNRQLVRSKFQGFARRRFIDARHFEHDASRLDHRHPLFRSAFAFTHAGLRRLLGKRLVRENPDPKLSAALDESRDRYTRSFDLAVGDPSIFHGLEPVLAKRKVPAAPRFAFAAAAHLLSVLHLLR